MKPVRHISEVFESFDQVKATATDYQCNFFMPPNAPEDWAERELFFLKRECESVFLLKKCSDFYRVFFASPSKMELPVAISSLTESTNEILVCDLVGKPCSLRDLISVFERGGFQKRKCLVRLTMQSPELNSQGPGEAGRVSFAKEADAKSIEDALQGSFDRLSERLPTRGEIEKSIENQEIFVIREDGELSGLLHFEFTGFNSHLRFWWVDNSYRGSGVGSELINRYFSFCSKAKRFLLWVESGNEKAIAAYENYGFRPDGLIDQILVWKGKNQ